MRENDRRILRLVEDLRAEEIESEALVHQNACGPGALAAANAFARERGASKGIVLEHTSSHEEHPREEFNEAVGYAAAVAVPA